MMKKQIGFSTKSIHDVTVEHNPPHVIPIHATSSFEFDTIHDAIDVFTGKKEGFVYSRYANPTITAVEQKIATLATHGSDLEAFAVMTSSGMSAVHTLLSSITKAGDKILTQGNLYGGTTELLTKVFAQMNIETEFQNISDPNRLEAKLKKDDSIKVVYFETPANPTLDCLDIQTTVALCKKYGCISVIDNTFSTPYLQRPFEFGVDFVIHSTTKYMNGHGTGIAGVILGLQGSSARARIWQNMKLMGTNTSPFEAWLVNNGLKTLSLRMERHCSNALRIAQYLESHAKVAKVNYPGLTSFKDHEIAKAQMHGFGGMLSFVLDADLEQTLNCINQLELCKIAPTLGDADTLVLHPTTSSHLNVSESLRLEYGITDSMVRLSVGLENVEDLLADLGQAIDKIA